MRHRILSVPTAICLSGLLLITAGAIARSAAPTPADDAPPPGSAARGRQLFNNVGCSQCHGTAGQGAITGPRLAPQPLPYAALAYIVRNPVSQMPAYSPKILSDADVADIWTYLDKVPKPRPADQIPMLRTFRK